MIINNKPKSLLNIYRTNRFNRHKATLSLINLPKKEKVFKKIFMEHRNTYNILPTEIKSKSKNIFKRELKYWIKNQPKDSAH